MREIRFRAWSVEHKIMIPDIQNAYDGVGIAKEDCFGDYLVSEKHYKVSQYTGLKDKNSKEIYEGDIVQLDKEGDTNGTAIVRFWERPPEFGLDFYHNEDRWIEDWNLTDDSEDMEVIGNIYENPELLND